MPERPNIVLILADDMGYGDFGAFNDGLSRTPILDALMQEGVCLTQHYSASPVCNPSRAALLTGRYPHRTGSIDTLEYRGLERLALRETTLADVLAAAGYCTGLVGKWHLGAYDERYHPRHRGFHETVCFRGGMHDYYRWRIEFGDTVKRGDGRYLTDVWTEEAVAFIERRTSDQPFFLHVTYNAPHTPLQVPDDEFTTFAEKGAFTDGVSKIYGMIRRMDTVVGRILEAIDRGGHRDNTIVMFTSDNGPHFGGTGQDSTVRFNCNFNGAKTFVYEGGIRVPMIVRWPAGLPGTRHTDAMVHFTDWFPTLLAATGVDVPSDLRIDGVNILPALRGDPCEVCTKRFWQWNRYAPLVTCNAAVRDGNWKLVRPKIDEAFRTYDGPSLAVSMYHPEVFIERGLLPGSPDPPEERNVPPPPAPELYDLADDPYERNNLADVEPERTHRLLRDLETWFEDVESDRATINDTWKIQPVE